MRPWLVEMLATHRAGEDRVPEVEDAAVGRHLGIARTGRRAGNADHRLVQVLAAIEPR